MILQVTRVRFLHGQAGTGALRIRRDGSTAADRDVAAYALVPNVGQTLAIEAEFDVSNADGEVLPAGTNVAIRARPVGDGAAILGEVTSATVAVAAPGTAVGPFRFELNGAAMFDKGVGKYHVAWSWEVLLPGALAWAPFQQTQHTIYVTLDVPRPPWTQTGAASPQLPWTAALDHACKWAKGVRLTSGYSRAAKSAARRIEAGIHDLGGATVTYDGHASFVVGDGAELDLGGFLEVVGGSAADLPATVNCSDCAALVAAFTNLIGGDLELVRIDRSSGSLQINDVLPIGRTQVFTGRFDYHDIAVRGTDEQAQVFDATLQPDWDVASEATRFELTEGRRRGPMTANRSGRAYLQRLLEPTEVQFEKLTLPPLLMPCLRPCGGTPRVDPIAAKLHADHSVLIQSIAEPSGDPIVPRPRRIPAIDVPGFAIYNRVEAPVSLASLEALVLVSAEFGYVPADPRERLRDVRQRLEDARVRDAKPTRFRLTIGWSPSVAIARAALAWLMTHFSEPFEPAPKTGDQRLGDAALLGGGERAVFFVRRNVLARVVAIGEQPASALPIAMAVDAAIRRDLRPPEREQPADPPRDRPISRQL